MAAAAGSPMIRIPCGAKASGPADFSSTAPSLRVPSRSDAAAGARGSPTTKARLARARTVSKRCNMGPLLVSRSEGCSSTDHDVAPGAQGNLENDEKVFPGSPTRRQKGRVEYNRQRVGWLN